MKTLRALRIGAVLAMLLPAMPSATASAAGPVPVAPGSAATAVEPLFAAIRQMGSAGKALSARHLDPYALGAALLRRMASFDAEAAGRRESTLAAAKDVPLTTGSITGSRQASPKKPATAQNELLASVAIPFGRLPALAQLQPVYDDMAAGLFRDCRTATCENARATLETVIGAGKPRGFLELIGAVNRSVNRLVAYRRDSDIHRVVDYWATPSQTLNSGIGDCEDYAILKMAVLAKAGVPARSMSLVVLRDERRGVYHAVLAIRTSAGSYILDNLNSAVLRDVDLPDYMPLYSVSAGRGYIYGRRGGGSLLSASAAGLDAIAPGEGLDLSPRSPAPYPVSADLRGPF